MKEQEEYAKALEKRFQEVGEVEDYISLLLYAIFDDQSHNMLIGEKNQKEFYGDLGSSFVDEISTFEKVDLFDYWEFVEKWTDR